MLEQELPLTITPSDSSSDATVRLTERAAKKVWELISEEGNLNLKLRVYVIGGGCSGFQYGFSFTETINDDDFVSVTPCTEQQSVSLLVDSLSAPYLQGAEIDYQDDVSGERFIIRNPTAKTTCGCGSSFSVD